MEPVAADAVTDRKRELDTYQAEYADPSADRKVEQRIEHFVSDFVISKLSGERILELGVGDGIWTPKLVERFPQVTTVDGSRDLLAGMEERLRGRRWAPVCSLFEDYRPRQRFDTVVASYVLEHVDEPALIVSMARRSWLKEGGRLAVVVPHALSLHRRLGVKMGLVSHPAQLGESDWRIGHQRCFTCHELERMIVEGGFRILEQAGMFTKLFPNGMLVQCSDEQLRGMFELGRELPIEYSSAVFVLAQAG
jgi:2-polyprenyl-3-methyl-5-hydroxy-6-metoxy-1,4-benzoquinol methylase